VKVKVISIIKAVHEPHRRLGVKRRSPTPLLREELRCAKRRSTPLVVLSTVLESFPLF
jgi:hypothetical protein